MTVAFDLMSLFVRSRSRRCLLEILKLDPPRSDTPRASLAGFIARSIGLRKSLRTRYVIDSMVCYCIA